MQHHLAELVHLIIPFIFFLFSFRLQLMCYKYLWDNLVSNKFPSEQFYEFFSMDPQHILSDEVKMNVADAGFPAEV